MIAKIIENIFSGIGILFVIYIIPLSLDLIFIRANRERSLPGKAFDVRPNSSLAFTGAVFGGFSIACAYGAYVSGQLNPPLIAIYGAFLLISVLLMLAPVKHFWDQRVTDDSITAYRLWIIKRTVSLREIDRCVMKRGGLDLYVNGKRVMFVDGQSNNIMWLCKRIVKNGVKITVKQKLAGMR